MSACLGFSRWGRCEIALLPTQQSGSPLNSLLHEQRRGRGGKGEKRKKKKNEFAKWGIGGKLVAWMSYRRQKRKIGEQNKYKKKGRE